MKRNFLSFILVVVVACSFTSFQTKDTSCGSTNQSSWEKAFNENRVEIDSFYAPQAIIIDENNRLYQGYDAIKNYYSNQKEQWISIDSVFTDYSKTDILTSDVKYEIGGFTNAKGEKYNNFILWTRKDDKFLKELEVIFRYQETDNDCSLIEQRRLDWVAETNSHQLEQFLNNLYTNDAVYYWNSLNKLYYGQKEITEAYSYMLNSNWEMESLTPYFIKPINDSAFFEIGNYKGAGGSGDYCLVWKKTAEGIWKISLDSNF